MEILQIIIYIICALFIVAGCIVSLVSLPGYWLIFASFVISGIADDFNNFTPVIIITVFVICLCSTLIDNVAVIVGAKRYGASRWGLVGAIIGSIAGLVSGNLAGLILGPLLGAFIFEILLAQKEWKPALKAGFGTLMGLMLGIITKFVINIGLGVLWVVLVVG